ncbi:hypothetical protein E6Q11_01990 [Candidatus Dojkabacteria bacterium]|uniref:Uncharacterized protein n=1 Tax=Candidatus Dojkabacteria bacterium TaxID=2099670 RepID=A0A5C7J9P0_9BACT|nr:MAG: hypothetical protein E6Q11_01990 [Candidatus Dojkabacteria bacterium]
MTAEREPREPYPLEGKYIVYSYVESSEGYVEEFLVLYKFTGGRYEGLVTPFNFGTGDPDALDDRTIEYLLMNDIKEVYDVFSLHGEMPIRSGSVVFTDDRVEEEDHDEDEFVPLGSDNWCEFKLNLDDAHVGLLRDAGIQINKVRFDEDGGIIITPDEE